MVPLPETALTSLRRAHDALEEATLTVEPTLRYATAHVAALRATAALLAVRTSPVRRGPQRNAWVLLAEAAPEMGEWAAFFSAGAQKRAAAEAGLSRLVSSRDADDLMRAVERYVQAVEAAVEAAVGLPSPAPLPAWPHRVGGSDVA